MGSAAKNRVSDNVLETRSSVAWTRPAMTAAHLLIGLIWTTSGVGKLVEPTVFQEAVRAHGVVPASLEQLIWLLPPVEMAIGIGVLVFGSRQRPSVFLGVCSFGLIILLMVYLSLVPQQELARSGCGCGGLISRAVRPIPIVEFGLIALFALLCLFSLVIGLYGAPYEQSGGGTEPPPGRDAND